MQEYDLDEYEDAAINIWHRYDWTACEVKFVQEYLQHGNPARAYIAAHGKEYLESLGAGWRTRAIVLGQQMARRQAIAAYIKYARDMFKERLTLTSERVLEELASIAYANMADFVVIQEDGTPVTDLSGLTKEQFAAVQEVSIDVYMEGRGEGAQRVKSTRVKLSPKIQALELLGKHFKLFTDVIETSDVTDAANDITAARQRSRLNRGEEPQDKGEENEHVATGSNDAANERSGEESL